MWWDVEVQVHFFLVECGVNPAILDADGKVHEVALVSTECEFPSQVVESVDQSFEFVPELFIGCWVGMA